MKISIIIPTYNSECFFEDTLLSVINQDYPNKEIIIIDGGSNDKTVEIIKKYEGHIAYWESKEDFGQFHAVNKGILRATGDIIGLLGSDDKYQPGALTKVTRAFKDFPDEKLIYGEAYRIDINNNVISIYGAKQTNYKELASVRCFIPCQSAFFKKSVVSVVGLMNTSFFWVSDWEYWIRISKKFGCKFINETLGAWRINPYGVTCYKRKGYYKKNIENIVVSFKYSHNLFTRLIRCNIWGLFCYYFPFTISKMEKIIRKLSKKWHILN